MRKIGLLLLAICLLILSACAPQTSNTHTPNSSEITDEQLYALLFDINNKVSLQLDMDNSELAKLQADYEKYSAFVSKSPIYRMGNLKVTIQTPDQKTYTYQIEEVGVRMKGNTSRTDFYNEEDGIYNLIHLKIDFQETFDDEEYYGADAKKWNNDKARKERKNRTFATLEKLDLRWNRCDDSTYLKEYFAYETYRQYDVPAPHTNLCSFDWAGVHMGVYTINEPIDDIFLNKYLPTAAQGGDLYKIGWAGSDNGSFTSINSIGIEDEDSGKFYAYDLKTNKKTSTHQSLIQFIENLNGGNVTKESLAEWVDMNSFLPFCAVSYLLGNPDDIRNNYNNCYVYFRADNGKAVLIPYDFDRCLGVTMHWNPTGNGVTSDNPFSANINATNAPQQSPLFLHSVVAGGYYIEEYAKILKDISDGQWLQTNTFAKLYDLVDSHYSQLSRPGKTFYNTANLNLSFDLNRTSPFTGNENISFSEYLSAKKATLAYYLENIDQYKDARPQPVSDWYICSDASNWQPDMNCPMTEKDGKIVFSITTPVTIRLKIYNNSTKKWYGTECIADSCTVPYESDSYTNIVLSGGEYQILFDPANESIQLITE